MKFLDANFGGVMYNFEVVILAWCLFDRNFRQIGLQELHYILSLLPLFRTDWRDIFVVH